MEVLLYDYIGEKIYPRTNDTQTVYLKNVITDPNINIGDYTMYNDFVYDPRDFQKTTCYTIIQLIVTD